MGQKLKIVGWLSVGALAGALTTVSLQTTARGAFLPAQMLPAAQALRDAVARSEVRQPVEEEEAEEEGKKKEPVVALRQRAWPLIDMLERTAKAGPDANIVWEAAAPF